MKALITIETTKVDMETVKGRMNLENLRFPMEIGRPIFKLPNKQCSKVFVKNRT